MTPFISRIKKLSGCNSKLRKKINISVKLLMEITMILIMSIKPQIFISVSVINSDLENKIDILI